MIYRRATMFFNHELPDLNCTAQIWISFRTAKENASVGGLKTKYFIGMAFRLVENYF